ncbi:MAG TPA: YbaB/EbfC family nucleoid-associated protein [Pseudonocardiaceae bacterium]|nr:YbaB/EbfC family nucleoid-associated protein [Pseudonocardiaceae bacterium]
MNSAVDPAESERWLANYNRTVARAAANAQAASASLRQVGGSASSPRGEVAVRVDASGALEDLRLTPAARAMEADQLAKLILATTAEARRVAGAQVVEIMTEYVGEGPALDMVRQNLPLPPADPRRPVDDRPDDDYFANPPEILR